MKMTGSHGIARLALAHAIMAAHVNQIVRSTGEERAVQNRVKGTVFKILTMPANKQGRKALRGSLS
jgi:hypothetical protein